ncbi:hypothetical protein EDB83DRAFT_272583 [Lactarius deliciosus]|nr:hypothetical protein EDB83DRAFT_272583 [Lactarius deliciosus]
MNVYEHSKGGETLPTEQVAQSGLLWSYPCKCPVRACLPCSRRAVITLGLVHLWLSRDGWPVPCRTLLRRPPHYSILIFVYLAPSVPALRSNLSVSTMSVYLSVFPLTDCYGGLQRSIAFILTFFCRCLCRVQSIWQLAYSCGAAACCRFGIRVPGPAGEPRNPYVAGPTP